MIEFFANCIICADILFVLAVVYMIVRYKHVCKENNRMLDRVYLDPQGDMYMSHVNVRQFDYMLVNKFYVWPVRKLWPGQLQKFCKKDM